MNIIVHIYTQWKRMRKENNNKIKTKPQIE